VGLSGATPEQHGIVVIFSMQDMAVRSERQQLELVWRGAASYGPCADVWVHNYPTGLCLYQSVCAIGKIPYPECVFLSLLSVVTVCASLPVVLHC
jgi:hypothetical protein